MGGVGAVIRDWKGNFIAAGARKREGIGTALQVELLAVLEGLWLVASLGLTKVVVESDSSLAIAATKEPRRDLLEYGLMAEDVLQEAASFAHIEFMYASRTCNGLAHQIAQVATAIGSELVWFDEPSDFIQDLLVQDMM